MQPALIPGIRGTGAIFSQCGKYRYRLWRYWSQIPPATFIMLNPSTADETLNDPTVERCQRRAYAMGWGGLEVVNLFALRSTDPNGLYESEDSVGRHNDYQIVEACLGAGIVICAWGNNGAYLGRSKTVKAILERSGIKLHHLGLTSIKEPRHPLYVSYRIQPMPWGEIKS